MKRSIAISFFLVVVSVASFSFGQTPTVMPIPKDGDIDVTLKTAPAAVDDKIALYTTTTPGSCSSTATAVPLKTNSNGAVLAGGTTSVELANSLVGGEILCAVITNAATTYTTPEVVVGPGCASQGKYSDCTFEYMLIGGIEQSDLSAQSSVTEGFYDLFLRRPVNSKWGSIWFRSRYLGTPSSSSTQNIVAAATNPTGTLTASNLPQSITAVDYTLGLQLNEVRVGSPSGRTTISPILGFGATTPLSATTTVSGFAVPAYGTNECNQLQQRFTVAHGYSPALPASGIYDAKGDMGCVVQVNPNGTATTATPGTEITAIAFSNEDRSSFLIKWGAGIRLIDRSIPSDSSGCASTTGCSRIMADFTLGQDQAITGGYLRRLVLKADAIIPIFSTGISFFAASANRMEHNTTLSPLILNPVTVMNAGSSSCSASSSSTSNTVCVPSSTVFVLPYKQQDRDYYRIGIGIDAIKVLTKLFPAATK